MFIYSRQSCSVMPYFFWFRKQTKSEVRKPKRKAWIVTEEDFLSFDEYKLLRKHALCLKKDGLKSNKFHLVRDWFVVELGLFTGLRVSEMAALQIKDFFINSQKASLIVRDGKGGKTRSVLFNLKFKKICLQFLKIRAAFRIGNDGDSYLLSTIEGNRVSSRLLQQRFKNLIRQANLPERYTIHNMRHTYATYLAYASKDAILVKEQLGHSSLSTTQGYMGLLKEKAVISLEKLYRI